MARFVFTFAGPTPPEVSIGLTIRRSVIRAAPDCVRVGVTSFNGFDGSDYRHGFEYWIDFGDPGSAFGQPQNLRSNTPNFGRARWSSHVYNVPGTYFGAAYVREIASGKMASQIFAFTVSDPDTVFPGTKTLFVDTAGNFAGKPAGAQEFTTLDAAIDAIENLLGPWRIMCRAGQTFSRSTGTKINEAKDSLWIVSSVPGTKFTINRNFTGGVVELFRLQNFDNDVGSGLPKGGGACRKEFKALDFQTTESWDAATETGDPDAVVFSTGGCRYMHIQGVEASGYSMFFNGDGGSGGNHTGPWVDETIVIEDCASTDWRFYSMYGFSQAHIAVRGNRLWQNPDACTGGFKNSGNFEPNLNNHGCLRMGKPGIAEVAYNDGFNNVGWSPTSNGEQEMQAFLRFNTNLSADAELWCHSNVAENGAGNDDATNVFTLADTQDMIFDGNVFVGGCYTAMGNFTARNNILIDPGKSGALTAEIDSPRIQLGDAKYAATPTWTARIYNNTVIVLDTTAQMPTPQDLIKDKKPGVYTITEENNIHAFPNRDTPLGDLPLDDTPQWVAHLLGYKLSYDRYPITLASPLADDATSAAIPYSSFKLAAHAPAPTQADYGTLTQFYLASGTSVIAHSFDGGLEVTLGASGFTFTNRRGSQINAGNYTVYLDRRGGTIMDMVDGGEANPPGTVWEGAPLTGNPAIGAASSGLVSWRDIDGTVRATLAAAHSRSPSKGAKEPDLTA